MDIYFCEYEAVRERLALLKDLSLAEFKEDLIVMGNGGGKYGTLDYGITDGTNSGYINIIGILSNNGPSAIETFFGLNGTGYSDVIEAIDVLVESGVDKIRFNIESPGGLVGIVDNLWLKIKSLDIETEAASDGLCASAAYYIASACDKITTTNPLSVWGSIGAVITGVDNSVLLKKVGIKVVNVVSGNAENKRLGVDTKEGIREIQKIVDSAERQFIGRIAEGRNMSADDIKQKFGRGGIMHAFDYEQTECTVDAINAGMVDYIVRPVDLTIEANGDILMNEEERLEIEKKATLKANAFNVKNVLKAKTYPKSVIAIGLEVITGDATIESFYAEIEEADKVEKATLADSIKESAEEEETIKPSVRNTKKEPEWMITDKESMQANANDFARR